LIAKAVEVQMKGITVGPEAHHS